MKRFLLSIPALVGSLLAGCASAPADPGPKPALWKVADADTTIYLFGTIHLLPPDTRWRTKAFDGAAERAQQLVLEIVPDGIAEQQAEAMRTLAYSSGLPALRDRVPDGKRAALDALIEKSDIPAASLDGLETWAAAIALASATLRTLDSKPGAGVEQQLGDSFKTAGKPIGALESVDAQMRMFDGLPEETQRRFLVSVIDDAADTNAAFAKMIKAWSSGDTNKIAASFDAELRQSPELAEALFHRRNAAWAEWIRKRLHTPGTVMVAVGAGHLAGKDSVQSLLQAQELKVERIQ
ncbi:TraB/GumN family protein [Sphingomonas colocasiae]|uniref:TraB/GumN family protein n=1 Tax=Sphingomonas colocasiae TaxID=1848973 RepID=A0ABS7PPV1_9SPHN|nr:TraB/GumN family protein [Sphingomonas colocasiae]MBY8822750.1 TraB/GumN family protein [Sphingomonas colocasiae]